ncbi:MAG: endonuclease/exonuclease/phosphatase family protein [Pseudomonadota bacterium]
MRTSQTAALLLLGTVGMASADGRIATWNANGVEKTPQALALNTRTMIGEIGTLDLLVLQEVISEEQVAAIAKAAGLDHWAISDFSPPVSITGNGFRSLEVAILSRQPMTGVAEWDTTGQEATGDGYPPRTSDPALLSVEDMVDVLLGEVRPSRGFLRADLKDGTSVYAVHWKSSRNEGCTPPDLENARKRELQAEGIVVDAGGILASGGSIIVVGDYNIQAPGQGLRAGTDSAVDCAPIGSCTGVCGAGGEDGYDDSVHTLLQLPGARLLSASLGETYIARRFGEGAIDHLLVAGPIAAEFEDARIPETDETEFAGSDHLPVYAVRSGGDEAATRTTDEDLRDLRGLIIDMRERLGELETLADRLETE